MPRVTQAFRDRQQARIYAAATRCFARAGFHATSMDDVIQEAGMSSSTIYRYLPGGKQELICSVCTWRIDKLAACLDQLRQETDPPGIRDALVSAASFDALSEREREILTEAAPLVQTRIQLLGEASGMLGFLFVADDALEIDDRAASKLKDNAADVLDAAIDAVASLAEFTTASLEATLRERIVDQMGVKPRLAFGPLRVAVTGRQVSPPLFESMEILGRDSSLARLRALRETLG